MEFAECITCGAEISFSTTPRMGQLVRCTSCNAELEVVWLDSIELDWPYEKDDDDEYYYDDDED